MDTNSFGGDQQALRLALYGAHASGKTCILSALSLPRVPHPDNLTCSWIESVPGHPLPSGDPDTWNSDDPFHIGWKWLRDQRARLRCGELPPPNPNREDAMRFLFAFEAPDQGTRQIELLDYSGELITASASELAAQLRNHMHACNGLLVLAEVPSPGHEHAPIAEDLEKLKGAFLLLLNERASGPQPDWPIALLFNKWDRRADQNGDGYASPSELVDGFLNQEPQPPHASLVQTLRNAVGRDNVRSFPVSAFGANQVRSDGAEVPLLEGALLKSRGLEDGFVWLMGRCDELRVEKLEQAARGASWYAFWQTPLGKLDAADGDGALPGAGWGSGVSPWAAISAGWRLRGQFPPKSDFRKRVKHAQLILSLKLASHLGVLVLLLLSLISGTQTAVDGVRYRTVLATQKNPAASPEQLQNAEAWLDEYFKASGYFRWLSHAKVLSRTEASTLLVELRTSRDDKLWNAVTDATSPQTKRILAREYLKAFPILGTHSHEATSLDAEAVFQESQTGNRGYLDKLALKIAAVRLDANTDIADLLGLSEAIGLLPHPTASSKELEILQQDLRARLAAKQSQIAELARQTTWEKFRQTYFSLMHNKSIEDAAKVLVARTPKEPELRELVDDFVKLAPPIIQEKVRDELKFRNWQLARNAAALCNDPNVEELLSAADAKELRKLAQTVDEAEDQDIYSQIIKNRPQCADQVSAYLSRAPLKAMKSEVGGYQQWISKMSGPLNVTLTLSGIQWHEDYWARRVNYYNDVTVQLQGKPVIAATGVLSKANTRSAKIGDAAFSAKMGDTVTIDVTVIAKYTGMLLVTTGTMSGGSGSWTGTPDQLRSGVTVDLNGDGFTNKATFSIEGIPAEPKLPEWTLR